MDKLFNKELESAGSSGRADAAPGMTEKSERSAPDCHCETAQTKNNPANCFCAQSNETQKAKRQCGRIDVGIGATKQSDEIASHSFAMTGECGRSMVETLATLAIMGILGVAGVAAYNSAMNRYRANTLINEAQKRAVVVAGQIGFNNQTPSLAEFSPPNPTAGGTFGDVKTTGLTKQFGIQVSNVNKSICQNILNTIGDTTPIRRLSLAGTPTTPITSCEESNDFLFIYNNDMQGVASDTEYATDDSSCKSVCGKFNPDTHLCDESDCEIPTNTCTVDTDCNTENECMVCDTETSQCKNGCERVEYLESTGTQYIDTGFSVGETGKIETTIQINTNYLGSDFKLFGSVDNDSVGMCMNIFQGKYRGTTVPVSASKTEIQIVRGMSAATASISYDGNTYNAHDFWHSNPAKIDAFPIFAGTDTPGTNTTIRKCPYKCYYFKQYDLNGTPVRDFIPVKSPKGNCMFNRVPENGKLKLYCDANGSTFKTNKDN